MLNVARSSSLSVERSWTRSWTPPASFRSGNLDVSKPMRQSTTAMSSPATTTFVTTNTTIKGCIIGDHQLFFLKPQGPIYEKDGRGVTRVKFDAEGWNYWTWKGRKIHYLTAGQEGPAVVLVHGYGASAYHWRYNIPELAKTCRVYAIDLLGFGWSEKASVDYSNGKVWVEQISTFVRDVVGTPAVLAGNSLGGFASLATAANHPDLIRGVALLNGAGPFDDVNAPLAAAKPAPQQPWWDPIWKPIFNYGKRMALYMAFMRAKQPERIAQVLSFVYASKDHIDEDLIASIQLPAEDPNAREVFVRINILQEPPVTVNTLLAKLKVPLLLLWGDLDPWITPSRAERIKSLYPSATRVSLQAGHCPHDEMPEEANAALLEWVQNIIGL